VFRTKTNIIGVSSGLKHTLAWDSKGRIYSWGDGSYGKLGHPNRLDRNNLLRNEVYPKCILDMKKSIVV